MSEEDFSGPALARSDAGVELQPFLPLRTTNTPAHLNRAADKCPKATAQLIAAAVSLVGSPAEVRAQMRSTEEHFLDYCAGAKEPSTAEFERLIALIIREQGRLIAQNRNLLQQLRMEKKTNNR